MRGVMASNPALSGMLDANPRLKQLLTSPDAMQSMLSGACVAVECEWYTCIAQPVLFCGRTDNSHRW